MTLGIRGDRSCTIEPIHRETDGCGQLLEPFLIRA
jgi:hypothetical protein